LLSKNNQDVYLTDYITPSTRQLLQTTYPLLSEENVSKFPVESACGIHAHGAGKAAGDFALSLTTKGHSPYQLQRMAGLKMQQIAADFNLAVGTTKQDTINAVEDLLCDEYALELAFEGCRYYDLLRLARHKNAQSPAGYPQNFGFLWMKKKLEGRGWDESKMYLPFN
jgi:hypothetical protein